MRKALFLLMLVSNIMLAPAQDIIYLNIEDRPNDTTLCLGNNQQVHVNAQDCDDFVWIVGGQMIENITPLIIYPSQGNISITYGSGPSCGDFFHSFHIRYKNAPVPNSFTKTVWGKPGENTRLRAMEGDSVGNYNFQWQGGPNNYYYDVVETGTYPVVISSPCGTTTRTFIRYDMAELSVANTDPVTDQIYLQWDLEPSVAQNAVSLEVYRGNDTINPVGTANYVDGYWNDPDADNSAARTYWIRTIAYDGSKSPAVGPVQTIHMAYNMSYFEDLLNLDWNIPQGYELSWFIMNQLVYNRDGEPEIIPFDSVTADVHSFTCELSKFENDGKVFVEGRIAQGKERGTKISPNSNSTAEEILDIKESFVEKKVFDVFPNPAKGHFTVKGQGTISIIDILGKVLLTQEVDGSETVSLPPGEYVVILNKQSRKLVVQ